MDCCFSIFSKEHVMNIDLAPTFLEIAGLRSTPEQMDGLSLTPFFAKPSNKTWKRSTILIEHQGEYRDVTRGCPQFKHQNMAVCIPTKFSFLNFRFSIILIFHILLCRIVTIIVYAKTLGITPIPV